MTRWRDISKQMNRSLYIQPLPGVYCSAMDASSALNTCEYFNITLCMPLTWARLYFLCIWGCKSNEISLAQTTLTIAVVYIRGRMLGSDLTQWPPKQIMSVHWDTTGQTTLKNHWCHMYTGMPLEQHWLMLAPSGVQWRSSVNLHNWNTLEDHWSHKYTGMPLEPHWLMLAPSGVPGAI